MEDWEVCVPEIMGSLFFSFIGKKCQTCFAEKENKENAEQFSFGYKLYQ